MVQPLHLQDNLSKIPILQKIHESTRAVPEAEREQFAKQLNKEVDNKNQKTQDSKETEKNIIRDRQKKEGDKRKKKKYKTSQNTEVMNDSEQKIEHKDSGQLIDITI